MQVYHVLVVKRSILVLEVIGRVVGHDPSTSGCLRCILMKHTQFFGYCVHADIHGIAIFYTKQNFHLSQAYKAWTLILFMDLNLVLKLMVMW